jgi:mycofactocin precursor
MPDAHAAPHTEVRSEPADAAPEEPVIDEVLVEEVSIDGMCGVY